MQPVQQHLAAWDAHTGKAFSPEEMAAACCVPALLPNLLSACRAGPGELDCESPAPLTPTQGKGKMDLGFWLAEGMPRSMVTYGRECIAMQ